MDLLIFDLDGTLIDSKLDLANSVNAALKELKHAPLENEVVYSYVGNGAPMLIRRAMGAGAPQEDVDRALKFYLAYYREHMLDNTYLYPGVRESLDRFRDAGKQMAVLSNKPVQSSRDLIKGLGLGDHFFQVYGGNSFEEKKPHPIGVDTLVREAGTTKEKTLMIGDSDVDIETARNAGIRACAVSYGFQPEGFSQNPPDYLVDRFDEIPDLVLGNGNRPKTK